MKITKELEGKEVRLPHWHPSVRKLILSVGKIFFFGRITADWWGGDIEEIIPINDSDFYELYTPSPQPKKPSEEIYEKVHSLNGACSLSHAIIEWIDKKFSEEQKGIRRE